MREILLRTAAIALAVFPGQTLESARSLERCERVETAVQANERLSAPVSHTSRGCASRELVHDWTHQAQWLSRTAGAAADSQTLNFPPDADLSGPPFLSLQASGVRWQI